MREGTGDGGRVENGDAKNAFVLEWGGEEDAVDVDVGGAPQQHGDHAAAHGDPEQQ